MSSNLFNKIKELNKNSEYDCLLMFSGGKDSSYLLYFLSQELGLRVTTITLSHNFLDKKTLQNIESFASRFSKKHIVIENQHLNYAGRHFLETWINTPDEGSLITLCSGCRLGLIKIVLDTAKKENINVVITGLTPFEKTDYRLKLVNYPKGREGKLFFFLGYLRLILRNPSLVKNPKAFKYQIYEYYYFKNQKEIFRHNNITLLKPFYDFLDYDEAMIIDTLKNLNWQKASISGSSYWRADCNMNAVRQFFHNRISGYNEMEYYYGQMLKEGLISKEYYDRNIQDSFKKDDILKVLKASGLSAKAMSKYERFLRD
jgi:hypothetical protein